jgi:hypothetical protein
MRLLQRRRTFVHPHGVLLPLLYAVPLRQSQQQDQVSVRYAICPGVCEQRVTGCLCSWTATSLQRFGPTTFLQWFRFLSVLAVLYIFCWFNYEKFAALYMQQRGEDLHQSPHADDFDAYSYVEMSDESRELKTWATVFDALVTWITLIFIVLLAALRWRVRSRFYIPAMCETRAGDNKLCGWVEDVCCMACCQACAMAQMARHTFALVDERCDPASDPGPIEAFPGLQGAAQPVLTNAMHQYPQYAQQPSPWPSSQVPQAVHAPPAPVPTVSGQVEVGRLVQGHFPAPASSCPQAGVPTASAMAEVPVATHVNAQEAEVGVSRNEARS